MMVSYKAGLVLLVIVCAAGYLWYANPQLLSIVTGQITTVKISTNAKYYNYNILVQEPNQQYPTQLYKILVTENKTFNISNGKLIGLVVETINGVVKVELLSGNRVVWSKTAEKVEWNSGIQET